MRSRLPVAHRCNGASLERFDLPVADTCAKAEGVSGTSTGDLWVVGTEGELAGAASRGVSWRWGGVARREVSVPTSGAHQVELTDVVASVDRVWAVGRADGRPPALTWTGRDSMPFLGHHRDGRQRCVPSGSPRAARGSWARRGDGWWTRPGTREATKPCTASWRPCTGSPGPGTLEVGGASPVARH